MDVKNGMKWARDALAWCLALMVSASANARIEFHCDSPKDNIEKIVCEDSGLRSMDACFHYHMDGPWSDDFAAEHLKWVNETRDRCTSLQCLRNVYTARRAAVNALNPQWDCLVSCEEMKKHPDKIFIAGADTGSGALSPIEFDYECTDSLASLPFLRKLHELTEVIRNDRRECDGTSMYPTERDYGIKLAFAGMQPRLFAHKKLDVEVPDARALLRQWSRTRQANNRLYRRFMAEFEKAHPLLESHYRLKFGLNEEDASRVAWKALSLFLYRAVEDFPSDLGSQDPTCLPGAAR